MPAEQEPRTARKTRQIASFRPSFAPSRHLTPPIPSIQGQAAEYRARSADRQLGAEILELLQKNPPKPSFYVSLFSDFPSSEVNYIDLELPGKEAGRKPVASASGW
jgi:hypothetical protein